MSLPDNVKSKIENYASSRNSPYVSCIDEAKANAEFGYSCATEELERKDKEIERLKGLIEKHFISSGMTDMVIHGYSVAEASDAIRKEWQQFKTENNL